MEREQALPLRVRVNLGVISMKEYSTIPRYLELESQFSITLIFIFFLALCRRYSQRILSPEDDY